MTGTLKRAESRSYIDASRDVDGGYQATGA
jgi:hypothetical protein